MKLEYVILLFTTMDVSATRETSIKSKFRRVFGVEPTNLGLERKKYHQGVRNHSMCAMKCHEEKECLSFSYTKLEERCDIYHQLLLGGIATNVSDSSVLFSKIHPGENYTDPEEAPWIIIQRREHGDVDFYRNWTDYKNGFGDMSGDFWIGNDQLHLLTTSPRTLRIELESWSGIEGYAQYSVFQVANESNSYSLSVSGFSGNVSVDGMTYHNGAAFSTFDRNVGTLYMGKTCVEWCRGGWWYNACYAANLNGEYMTADGSEQVSSMTWTYFADVNIPLVPLKKSKMLIQ